MSGGSSRRYPPELRERAVRMVAEIRADQHGSEWAGRSRTGHRRMVHWFKHQRLYEFCGDIPPATLGRGLLRSTPEACRRLSRAAEFSVSGPLTSRKTFCDSYG